LIVDDEAWIGFVKTEVEGTLGKGRQLELDVDSDVNSCLVNGDEAETDFTKDEIEGTFGKGRNYVFFTFLLGSGEYLFVEHLFLGFDIY